MFMSQKSDMVGLILSAICVFVLFFVLFPMALPDKVKTSDYAVMDVVHENLPALMEVTSELNFEKPDFIRDNECGYYFTSQDKNYLILCTVTVDGKLNIEVQEVPG